MSSDLTKPSARGVDLLAARMSERCEKCKTERPTHSVAPCRCDVAQLQPFCPRCLKIFSGEICPHCLSVATTNGAKLLAALDARFAKERGLRGASAISDLRLEIASVDLALKTLGPYLGRPIEDKLAIKLTEGDSAAVFLVSWDFIAADSVHEGAIKAAAETLAGADQHVVTLLETIKKRNLSALVEAVVRRNRALEQCSRALGIH